jgi:hypothetical protein
MDYRSISRIVRSAINLSGTPYPIEFVDGFAAPKLTGRSYYWTTPSGLTEVRHPNAYKWPTWYHASTRKIVVGAGWVIERMLEQESAEDAAKAACRQLRRRQKSTFAEINAALNGPIHHEGFRFTAEGGIVPSPSAN